MDSRALAITVTVVGKPNDYSVQFLAIKLPFLPLPLPRQVILIVKPPFHLTVDYVFSLFKGLSSKTWGFICRNRTH